MSSDHSIRNGIIATVAAGIILAVLGRIWQPAGEVVASLGDALSFAVTLPLWAVLLVLAAMAVILIRARRIHIPKGSDARPAPAFPAPVERAQPDLEELPRLEGTELHVLAHLGEADGSPVLCTRIRRAIGVSNLQFQVATDRLIDLGYVELGVSDFEEDELRLTRRGREYVVTEGLV